MGSASNDSSILFTNAKVFQAPPGQHGFTTQATFHDSMVITNDTITYVGASSSSDLKSLLKPTTRTVDLGGKTILPGFIDGHMHLLIMGQSLQKASLDNCRSLEDIRAAVKAHAAANPDAPRIFARGWMHSMTPDGVDHTMLDDIDERPIFIDTKDLHSTWCNQAAIAELGIADAEDPPGGKIFRNDEGKPTGLLGEAAVFTIVWPHIAKVASVPERAASMRAAVEAYNAVGYTGLVDMAMDEDAWLAVREMMESDSPPPMRIAAYWLIRPSPDPAAAKAEVETAIEMVENYNREEYPQMRVVGIKIICDGIIDACTASLKEPYTTNEHPGPIWTREQLRPVVRRAAEAGVQIALHAIGDDAIAMAIDVLEETASASTVTELRRPRIEHLEVSTKEDAARLGRLGITASIQPVHSDPAILRAWPRLIGKKRCGRAFAYREFADGGAPLALGSDAPTAPHAPVSNMYVATTRRSAREPDMVGEDGGDGAVNPGFALGVCESFAAATKGAAYSTYADTWSGSLEVGKRADFVVVDMEWEKEKLLEAKVQETWFNGRRVFEAGNAGMS